MLFRSSFGHMKQECPTYLKTIGKRKAFTATLSNTEPEDDPDNEDDGILNAFTAIVNLIKGIVDDVDEEEDLVESNLRRRMNKMTSIQPMQNYTRSRKNMRSCIGWPSRSSVKWSLNEKKFSQSLMKPIRPLEY